MPWLTLSFKPATDADEQTLKSLLPAGEITDLSQLPKSIPSYLIRVIPELKLNGQLVKSGNAMRLGEEVPFVTAVNFVGRGEIQSPRTYNVIAGSYLAVNAYSGNVSPDILKTLQSKLQNTKTILDSANQTQIAALTREDLLGDMFHAGGLGYYAQLIGLNHIMGLQSGGHYQLGAGTGTFGYEPNVSYFFGIPKAIQPGGVAFDIPLFNIMGSNDGDAVKKKQFVLQSGILSSALEHAVPEQMFVNAQNPGEAISAVKALQKASVAGQRIYNITQANQATTLPNIHHDVDTMNEIRNALNAGKEVITHTDSVSVPGWSGAGYIITDPDTGAGAYKIAGGGNGGFFDNIIFGLSMLFATIGGAIDGFVASASDDLPFAADLEKALWAKKLEPLGKFLGSLTLLFDIAMTLDQDIDITDKIGRISVALLGFGIGSVVGAAIGAAFLPLAATIFTAFFAITLTIVLVDFSEIYFSLLFDRRFKHQAFILQA